MVGLQCHFDGRGDAQPTVIKERHEDLLVFYKIIVAGMADQFLVVPLQYELNGSDVTLVRRLAQTEVGQDVVGTSAEVNALAEAICSGLDEYHDDTIIAKHAGLFQYHVELVLVERFQSVGREGRVLFQFGEDLKAMKVS